MNIMHYIAGPLIGAVIGYCTNYIAVKMLFRPLKEIKIGGFTLPFTPGIIPKRKDALALAVGKAVGDALLTEEDLSSMLLSEDVENSVVELCTTQIEQYLNSEENIGTTIAAFTGDEAYTRGKELIQKDIFLKIMEAIEELKPGEIIAEEGKKAVRLKMQGTMLAMFLNDSVLDSLAGEIGSYAEDYIWKNAPQYIEQKLEKEVAALEQKHLGDFKERVPLEPQAVQQKLRTLYRTSIQKFASSIVPQFHISEIVEQKIKAMDVLELENLVMSVMKHELGMIVNLGALIGFLLGILNLLF